MVSFVITPVIQTATEGGPLRFRISIVNPDYAAIGSYKIYWNTTGTADHAANSVDYEVISILRELIFSPAHPGPYEFALNSFSDNSVEGTEYFSVVLYDYQKNYLKDTTFTIKDGVADLVIDELKPINGVVTAGDSERLTTVVHNVGTKAAGSFETRIYLSHDTVISSGDTLLTKFTTSGLAAGADTGNALDRVVDFDSGLGLIPGQYYLIVKADYQNSVIEPNNNDNVYYRLITIAAAEPPDLTVSGVTVAPGSVSQGGAISVSFNLNNIGSGASGASASWVYLSIDSTITRSDTRLNFIDSPSSIAAHGSVFQNIELHLPPGIGPGSYYIGVIADDAGNEVGESNENNNASAGTPLSVTATAPVFADLKISDLQISEVSPEAGQQVTLTFTAINAGAAGSASTFAVVYLSADGVISTADTALGQPIVVPSLVAGGHSLREITVPLPAWAEPGRTYHVGVIIDQPPAVTESNETNNTASVVVTIEEPDLPPPEAWTQTIVPGGRWADADVDPDPFPGNFAQRYPWKGISDLYPSGHGDDPITHAGVDIIAPLHSPVIPFANGRVYITSATDAENFDESIGHYVVLWHSGAEYPNVANGQDFFTLYAHLEAAPPFDNGELVDVSDLVGWTGDSGNHSGLPAGQSILHFEIRLFDGIFFPSEGTSWRLPERGDNIYINGDRSAEDLRWGPPEKPQGAFLNPTTFLIQPNAAGETVVTTGESHNGTVTGSGEGARLTFDNATGALVVIAKADGQAVVIHDGDNNLLIRAVEFAEMMFKGGALGDAVRVESLAGTSIQNHTVYFEGGGGDDTLDGAIADRTLSATGDAGRDELRGGAENDRLDGGDDDDVVWGDGAGAGGDDRLIGGAGADTMYGGPGDDHMYGYLEDFLASTVVLDGTDRLEGGEGSDTLRGSGGVDLLFGGEGDDTLGGRGGADLLDGGAGDDMGLITRIHLSTPYSFDFTTGVGGDITEPEGARFFSIERLQFVGGSGAENVTGGSGIDLIDGRAGNDILTGGDGADYLLGGAGDDVLSGGLEADWIETNTGNDIIDGGAASDIAFLDFRDRSEGLVFTLQNPDQVSIPLIGGQAAGSVTGVEQIVIYGTSYGDIMRGNAVNDEFNGGAGIDYVGYSASSLLSTWQRQPDGSWVIHAADSSGDHAAGVEFIDFTDRDVFLDRAYSTFSGDGTTDIFMQHSTGALGVWFVDSGGVTGSAGLGALDSTWDLKGVGDFNGDSKDDILMWNDNGFLGMWFMNGASVSSAAGPGAIDKASWDIERIGDLNGDGKDDILMWHDNGSLGVWFMNGASATGASLGGVDKAAWDIEGLADFNGDGKDDILWKDVNGNLGVWFMNGAAATGAGLGNIGTSWDIEGLGDFNGDGRDDILMRHDSGSLGVWFMNGATATGAGMGSVSQTFSVAAIGDYNGDGTDDILWWNDNGSLGTWFMNGASATGLGYGAVSHDWLLNPS